MRNFEKEIEKATDSELYSWVNTRNPHFTVLASNELIRRAVDKLQGIIKTFNEQSSKQTEKLVKLTWWIVGLTVVMVLGLAIQIIFAIPTKSSCSGVPNNDGSYTYTYTCVTNVGLGLLGNYSFVKQFIRDTPLP